jgi:hypothetical protein
MRRFGLVVMLALALPSSAAAFGVPFAWGDVLTSLSVGLHFSPTGQLLDQLYGGQGLCTDSAGDLYATGGGGIEKYDYRGDPIGSRTVDESTWSCVTDSQDDVYIGGSPTLYEFSPDGALLNTWQLQTDQNVSPTGVPGLYTNLVAFMSMGPDRCTIYYTSDGQSISRFNVCTGQQESDFVTGLPATTKGLSVRPDDEVLVIGGSEVLRLSPQGTVIQTYQASSMPGSNNGLWPLTLDPDGSSFWTADTGTDWIYRVDIASGAVLEHFLNDAGPIEGPQNLEGLVVADPQPVGGPITPWETLGSQNPSEGPTQCNHGDYPVNCGEPLSRVRAAVPKPAVVPASQRSTRPPAIDRTRRRVAASACVPAADLRAATPRMPSDVQRISSSGS